MPPTTLEDAVLEILQLAGRGCPVDVGDLSFWLRQDKHIFLPQALDQIIASLETRGYVQRTGKLVVYPHVKGCIEYARNEAWGRGYYFYHCERRNELQLCCRLTDQVCRRTRVSHCPRPDDYYALLRQASIPVESL